MSKYLDYEGLDLLWQRILKLVEKAEPKISPDQGNQLKNQNGLFVPKNHVLKFGPYEYDGTKDVSVTIYDGEYTNE